MAGPVLIPPLTYETYGPTFEAKVISRSDPDGEYKLKTVEMKRAGGEINWAKPYNFDPRTMRLPEVGQYVYIGYEGGDLDKPFWTFGPISAISLALASESAQKELFPPTDQSSEMETFDYAGGTLHTSSVNGLKGIGLTTKNRKNFLDIKEDTILQEDVDAVKRRYGAILSTVADMLLRSNEFVVRSASNALIDANHIDLLAGGDATIASGGDVEVAATSNISMTGTANVNIHSLGVDAFGGDTATVTISIGPPGLPTVKIEINLDGSWSIGDNIGPIGKVKGDVKGVTIGTGTDGSIASAGDSYVVTPFGVSMVQNIKNRGIHTIGAV